LGWRLDDDVAALDGLRNVQFTPPPAQEPRSPSELVSVEAVAETTQRNEQE
jgi:hypothetical protein